MQTLKLRLGLSRIEIIIAPLIQNLVHTTQKIYPKIDLQHQTLRHKNPQSTNMKLFLYLFLVLAQFVTSDGFFGWNRNTTKNEFENTQLYRGPFEPDLHTEGLWEVMVESFWTGL